MRHPVSSKRGVTRVHLSNAVGVRLAVGVARLRRAHAWLPACEGGTWRSATTPDTRREVEERLLVLGGWGTKTLDLSLQQHSAAARNSDHTASARDHIKIIRPIMVHAAAGHG